MKLWMMDVLTYYGFWGLVSLSAWPNAAFDLCGICCGNALMPFWTFFGGTYVGKALIKAPMQGVGFTAVFLRSSRETVIEKLGGALASVTPAAWAVDEQLRKSLSELNAKFEPGASSAAPTSDGFGVAEVWNLFIAGVILTFAATCAEQFAQMRQRELDERELDRRFPSKKQR